MPHAWRSRPSPPRSSSARSQACCARRPSGAGRTAAARAATARRTRARSRPASRSWTACWVDNHAPMRGSGLSRRELLTSGAAAGAALALRGAPARAAPASWSRTLDFAALPAGDGWPGWACGGVANLRRSGGRGLLEAGSDVFPCDPRPVAFAVDRRFRDGEIAALIDSPGAGAGVVLRRLGPRDYYAAIYDDEQAALVLVRRAGDAVHELARMPIARA